MRIIGITGPSGAGKTTALNILKDSFGAVIYDCDALYHALLRSDAAMLAAIEAAFPGTVRDGALDRKALAAIVFSDDAALRRLNALTHPRVKRELLRRMEAEQAELAAIDAIGLFEGGLAELCDWTVAVLAPEEDRIRRLRLRDGLTEDAAVQRVRAQKSAEEFASLCDMTIKNNGTPEQFVRACKSCFAACFKEYQRRPQSMSKCLRENLLYQRKNGYDRLPAEERDRMERYCQDYIRFLTASKTEREAVQYTIAAAEAAGYVPFRPGMELKPGDRVYRNNRDKSIAFLVIGSEPIDEGLRIVASHIDNPRLDLKPNPLWEDAELAFLKTHYYGGIKKYQWTTIPLSLHGVVVKENGERVTVRIGDDPQDPCFVVTDLLVHLAKDQMQKTLAEGVSGENLRVLVGSEPITDDDGSDRVKLAILQLLNERYGITEEDFLTAELTMVPAAPAREVGFDRSMIGGYGHDDRVCAYASFAPMLTLGTPKHTAVCMLADKEEIGSEGVSGMQSLFFDTLAADLCDALGGSLRRCYEHSFCLSADVTNAYDPIFPETCDKANNSLLNYGIAIYKYTGSRGKYNASDAAAEVVGRIRQLFNRSGVIWQAAEIGRIDQGGGGTVAVFMSKRNIETLDAGIPVLSMHAPMEVVGKLDCYMGMKGMQAIYLD